jgi:hypothetical protein
MLYNYNNPNNTNLISNKIDSYFNNLVTKIEPKSYKVCKNEYTFSKFYNDYIDHNILILFLLLCLVIFLIFRYYNKYYIENYEDEIDIIKNKKKELYSKNKQNKQYKLDKQLKYVKEYKKQLDYEKEKILSIIDELSSLENTQNNDYTNDPLDNTILYSDNDNNRYNTIVKPTNDYSDYYDFTKNFNEINTNEIINGMYIDPPYSK